MDKNAIKKYAVWARRELISRVSQKALQYGVSEKDFGNINADSVNGMVLSPKEKTQRASLIAKIKKDGYQQAMEEAAYTWFNRFTALRYMEVNGYLPSHVRVFTNDQNEFKPQIIDEAINLELDGLDLDKVYNYKESNQTEELYKYLLITQCNDLGKILPGMFTKISDYTEILFPDNLLREGSVIEQMIALIPEEDWQDQVQIIGWLYQYYNTEPKSIVDEKVKKGERVSKLDLSPKTQIFTPDWVVRYMVENSLGRLWHINHNYIDKNNWYFYVEESEQDGVVNNKLKEIRGSFSDIKPEQISCIDPSMGSGHILVYMFEMLIQIYEDYGYTSRNAAEMILKNNLFGLDIDERASQLAYFSVMMKARQYDRKIFDKNIYPHIYNIIESNYIDKFTIDYFVNGDQEIKSNIDKIILGMNNAKEYGSLIRITGIDFNVLYNRLNEIKKELSIYQENIDNQILPLIKIAQILSNKYYICCTNPPYLGCRNINDDYLSFIEKNYPDSKYDLFACFIERGMDFVCDCGFNVMVTMQSWMFLSSYEKFRKKIFGYSTIQNLAYMESGVMGIAFGTCATVFFKKSIPDYNGVYTEVKCSDLNNNNEITKLSILKKANHVSSINHFSNISGIPVAYWLSTKAIDAFNYKTLNDYAKPRQGMATSDNNKFLRLWYEVELEKINFSSKNSEEALESKCKWFPYNKGGSYRKWYGNNEFLVNWENDGYEIKQLATELYKCMTRTIKNIQFYFQEGITWSTLSSGNFSARYCTNGFLFDTKGSTCFFDNKDMIPYSIAFLNSKVATMLLKVLAPTMDFNAGSIARLPIKFDKSYFKLIFNIVEKCISDSRTDWDSFETSWDFKKTPLIVSQDEITFGQFSEARRKVIDFSLSECFNKWQVECNKRFDNLKKNEEEINRIFIEIYGLQDELTPEVEDKDVTVRKADLTRDIKSFISYAVGCLFGRYSLDVDGLVYAGGDWDASKYKTITPSIANIIPICDDEYFEDDLTNLFINFVKTVYGEDTLEENLKFIADALGGKGSSREIIRKYFLNDFFADHCKIYQKRPIYWLFDSGKKNGFKALIYMHRYQPDTIARIRTDYVHEQQNRYRTTISDIEQRMSSASTSERVKLSKELKKLNEQADELLTYEEKIHHLADQMISIDLDDGVKNNYEIFKDVLAKVK